MKSKAELQATYERAKKAGYTEEYHEFRRQFRLAHPECFDENGMAKDDHPTKYTLAAGFIIPRITHYIDICEREQRLNSACEEYEDAMRGLDLVKIKS